MFNIHAVTVSSICDDPLSLGKYPLVTAFANKHYTDQKLKSLYTFRRKKIPNKTIEGFRG